MRSWVSCFLVTIGSVLFLLEVALAAAADVEKSSKSPPPFFLQDPSDSLCLAGEEFKRCSIDTLFYVVGSPGMSILL